MADDFQAQNPSFRKPLTQSRLKELLLYDPGTGLCSWRVGRRGVSAGALAGSKTKRGRIRIKIDYVEYFAHQVAWLYMTGELISQIDHHDLDQSNNRWPNLRRAASSTNGANKRKQQMPWEMASKLKGVYRSRHKGKWDSRVSCRGKRYFLGSFTSEEAAHAAYVAKATELFGEFARAA